MKGNFVKRITVASTMGPGVKVDPDEDIDEPDKQDIRDPNKPLRR